MPFYLFFFFLPLIYIKMLFVFLEFIVYSLILFLLFFISSSPSYHITSILHFIHPSSLFYSYPIHFQYFSPYFSTPERRHCLGAVGGVHPQVPFPPVLPVRRVCLELCRCKRLARSFHPRKLCLPHNGGGQGYHRFRQAGRQVSKAANQSYF